MKLKKFFRQILKFVPDKIYLNIKYLRNFGRLINFNNPQTFSEKLQWLKLYNRLPIQTIMVDKYLVKDYVAKSIGEDHVVKTLGVWSNFDDFDLDKLPNQFVLKSNHNCGGIIICTDKSQFDKKLAQKFFKQNLKANYYYDHREWPYKHVRPLLFAEEFIVDESGYELKDYKFFCFDGEPKILKVDFGRFSEHHANYYDMEWNLLPFGEVDYPPEADHKISKPNNFKEMVEIVKILSKGHPFLRVDLYHTADKIYFGEMTFFPAGGFGKFNDMKWDYTLGSWINLPHKS